jgi:hypothetical protein
MKRTRRDGSSSDRVSLGVYEERREGQQVSRRRRKGSRRTDGNGLGNGDGRGCKKDNHSQLQPVRNKKGCGNASAVSLAARIAPVSV